MADEMRAPLILFLDSLEAIGSEHEEVYDTDVRERLAESIEEILVMRVAPLDVSDNLGMFSDEANRSVAKALRAFLEVVVPEADALGLDEAARRGAVWNVEARSSRDTTVDEFLGWPDQ